MSTTYSFKDSSGAFTHPVVGAFLFAGEVGFHQMVISMATEKTAQNVASDGAVMVSYIAGDNGTISFEVQQTSALHAFLLAWYNTIKALANEGNVQDWATAAITIRSIVDGSLHEATGVSPAKVPDKVYAAQGQNLTWLLHAADIQSITLGVL